MIIDIFASFDPHNYLGISPSLLIWVTPLIFVYIIPSSVWVNSTPRFFLTSTIFRTINNQVNTTSAKNLKSTHLITTALFIRIIIVNFYGLIPYSFSTTTHLSFTLVLALPLWLGIIISSVAKSPYNTVATLLPGGAPTWLNPFLVIIETIRMRVRPLTLAFRLAANIRAGHIVLTLIGIYLSSALFNRLIGAVSLSLFAAFYTAFEIGICLVQAFIFCLLITLYSNDHQ